MKKLALILCCLWAWQVNAQYISVPKEVKPIPQKADLILPDFYTQHMAFFCKQELKFEHRFHLPLVFRLGSLEYNNWLEQKTGYRYRP